MLTLPSPHAAAQWCGRHHQKKTTIGYVPTMGALHDGHLSLVARSIAENQVTCSSIFINPLQFNNPDDMKGYPQNIQQDIEALQRAGCDMVYRGTLQQFFPQAKDVTQIKMQDPGPPGKGLEEKFRANHLQGVVTIVERLFRTVGTCRAYFGEKDYQQTLVVKHLAQRLKGEGLVIDVIPCPTIREHSGLAMSSRNQRLTENQKQVAANIYRALLQIKTAWETCQHEPIELQRQLREQLEHPDITIEYAAVRDQNNWSAHTPNKKITNARALVAAYVGDVRLIDNLYLGKY